MITLTAAGTQPVSLIEAKLHVKLITDPNDASVHPDDAAVTRAIKTAREQCEEFCERAFGDGTYLAEGCGFSLALLAQVATITSVKYLDSDGVEQTLASTVYELNAARNALRLKVGQVWPSIYARDDAVRVVFVTDAAVVPESVKSAMLLVVGTLYDNRASELDRQTYTLPLRVQDLLRPYRLNMGV